MKWELLRLTVVRYLLRELINSEGYEVVKDSRKELIVSQVMLLEPGIGETISQCFEVQSIKVIGIRKLKTEDSLHLVVWDGERMSCNCERAKYGSFTCRHRQTVAATVSRMKLVQLLTEMISTLDNSDRNTVKNFAFKAYDLTKEMVLKKGGIVATLSQLQKLHLLNTIQSKYGGTND